MRSRAELTGEKPRAQGCSRFQATPQHVSGWVAEGGPVACYLMGRPADRLGDFLKTRTTPYLSEHHSNLPEPEASRVLSAHLRVEWMIRMQGMPDRPLEGFSDAEGSVSRIPAFHL